jgi:hypothetical protein
MNQLMYQQFYVLSGMPACSGKIYRMKGCESPSRIKPELYQAQQPPFSDTNWVISDGALTQHQGCGLNLRFGQPADVGQEMPEELKKPGPLEKVEYLNDASYHRRRLLLTRKK